MFSILRTEFPLIPLFQSFLFSRHIYCTPVRKKKDMKSKIRPEAPSDEREGPNERPEDSEEASDNDEEAPDNNDGGVDGGGFSPTDALVIGASGATLIVPLAFATPLLAVAGFTALGPAGGKLQSMTRS